MEKATEVAMRAERIAEQMGKLDDAATSGLARECTGNERTKRTNCSESIAELD